MARVKWFGYLLNEQGQVIPGASISIYLAGTETPATIYTSESGSDIIQIPPQLTTNADGYYEFWMGDTSEDFGYSSFQKFKIAWEKPGIAEGYNDYISILPLAIPVDTEGTSEERDKSISNNLGRLWEEHRTTEDPTNVHGIGPVDLNSTNTEINKLVSDAYAKEWEDTKWIKWEYVDYASVEAESNRGYLVDARDQDVTIFLPSSPAVGDTVALASIYVTNQIKVDRNTQNIFNDAQDLYIDLDNSGLTLVFVGSDYGWTIVSEISGVSPLDGDTIEIDYLPDNYQRDETISFAEEPKSLSAHLKGIDDKLADVRESGYVYETINIADVFDGSPAPGTTETLSVGNGRAQVRKFSGSTTEYVLINLETTTELLSADGMQFKTVSYVTESTEPSGEGIAFAMEGYTVSDGDNLDQAFNTDVVTSRPNLTLDQYDRIDSGWSNDLDLPNLSEASSIQLRLSRPHDHTDDTYSGDIGISHIKLRYRINEV